LSEEYIHLENDGKILLVDENGKGPKIPQMGREKFGANDRMRLPTVSEAKSMGITWKERRINRIRLGVQDFLVIYGIPEIPWPENWAWKDAVISDSAVDPLARESVYRTLHRVVSKVVISNSNKEILMAKVSRGFFSGCWTLPGGFVDYSEHPRKAAQREAEEELGVKITIADPNGEVGDPIEGDDGGLVQTAIFNEEGLNWVSFTYLCETDLDGQKIIPKDDEIEEACWLPIDEALNRAVSFFDIEAIKRIR
tara:strand:+ start:188 stop:946 length:759 start_codon:yes stop_codon:yes gene_type:complete